MAEHRSYSVSEVTSLVRVKPRAVQYWVEASILRPDAATAAGGRGVRRAFQPSEVRVAGVAAALGPFGMSTPVLKNICDYAREVVNPELPGRRSKAISRAVKAMRAGQQVILGVIPEYHGEIHIVFIEPERNSFTLENLSERFGRCIVLVDLKTAMSGLP